MTGSIRNIQMSKIALLFTILLTIQSVPGSPIDGVPNQNSRDSHTHINGLRIDDVIKALNQNSRHGSFIYRNGTFDKVELLSHEESSNSSLYRVAVKLEEKCIGFLCPRELCRLNINQSASGVLAVVQNTKRCTQLSVRFSQVAPAFQLPLEAIASILEPSAPVEEDEHLFSEFKKTYKKAYPSKEEEAKRFQIFQSNLKLIKYLQDNEQGTAEYAVNQFADLSPVEFRKKRTGYRPDKKDDTHPLLNAAIPDVEIPEVFDWRLHKAVSPVEDQKDCASSWAFAVAGTLEGQYAIRNDKLVSLSPQELLDCDKKDAGCDGGFPDNAYRVIGELGGLQAERDYPYVGRDQVCHSRTNKTAIKVESAIRVSSNEEEMAQWMVRNGPMAAAINAESMQFYQSGVAYPGYECNPKTLDHAVLIVGYSIEEDPANNRTLPYWLVKNSWGTSWGEEGYYRIYRGDGSCGINQDVSTGVVG